MTEMLLREPQQELFENARYICHSCTLITDALKKGNDVLQLSNGDIAITETKTFTYKYHWDDAKGKFVRMQNAKGYKKPRKKRLGDNKPSSTDSNDEQVLFAEMA